MTELPGLVSAGDVELWVDATGDGPPLVMAHGWTGSSRGWCDVTPHLAADHRVVVYDQRGHGQSTHTEASGYTFDHLVDDLAAIVDALELESFDLLGHSMGGAAAMRYAIRHPDRVRSLLLVDTGATTVASSADMMQPLIDIVRNQGLAGYLEAALPYVGTEGEESDRRRADFAWEITNMDPVAFVTFAEALCTPSSVLHALPVLDVPTTVIVGEHDVHLRQPAKEMAEAIAGSVLDVIPGAAHVPYFENPPEWLAAVDRHFARLAEAPTK